MNAATPAKPICPTLLDRLVRLPQVSAARTNPYGDGPRYVVVVRCTVRSFWTEGSLEDFITREEERHGVYTDAA